MAQILPISSPPNYGMGSGLPPHPPGPVAQSYAQPSDGLPVAVVVGMLRRNWLLMMAVVCLSVATAYTITRMATPVYRASTTLYFAERQGSMPALDVLTQMESGNDQVATEMEVMRSRALAGITADSLGMQVR